MEWDKLLANIPRDEDGKIRPANVEAGPQLQLSVPKVGEMIVNRRGEVFRWNGARWERDGMHERPPRPR
jgi:hypothetical protein